jgi:RHS repeat-associated protein
MANDQKGDVVAVINANGVVLENTSYGPYGTITSGSTLSKKGYEGKEADSLVGDTDFNARKYRQDLGIFTQPDSDITDVYDPQSLNRYTFEKNNPTKYRDNDGHSPVAFFAAGAFLVGAAWYWYNTPIDPNNPQWGNRFIKGAEHGGVDAAFTLATLPLAEVGGAVRVVGASADTIGKLAVAGGGANLWHNAIDGTQTTVMDTAIQSGASAASGYIPGLAEPGQYGATVRAWTGQNYKMLADYLAGYSAAGALARAAAWLNTNSIFTNAQQQASPATSGTTTGTTSGSGSGGGGGGGGSSHVETLNNGQKVTITVTCKAGC